MTEIYLHIDARMTDYIRTHRLGVAGLTESPVSMLSTGCVATQYNAPAIHGGAGRGAPLPFETGRFATGRRVLTAGARRALLGIIIIGGTGTTSVGLHS